MIRLIQGADAPNHPNEMDAMFRARAHVFRDRLGWDVAVIDGREIDEYDAANPLYLLSIDRNGAVRGSLRLLPTAGPNMLRDKFAALFDQPMTIESGTIWECTRFCLHPDAGGPQATATGAMRATWEMMLGICEVGLKAGLTQIEGVYDHNMIRVYRKTRWSPIPIAQSRKAGTVPIYVGLWDVTEQALEHMRKASGISDSVLEPTPVPPLRRVA